MVPGEALRPAYPVTVDHLGSNLLQVFRFAHAVAEAGVPLATDAANLPRWHHLTSYLPAVTIIAGGCADRIDAAVDHAEPRTSVGELARPLVFAHAVADRCAALWTLERTIPISFAGLMTERRGAALAPLTDAFGDGFRVVATDAGRQWPGKAWDDSYYALLGRSQLVACPDGDYVWTYRFFEAALCGAVPVIQSGCIHYEGFRFYRMGDDPASMAWRPDWAAHNAARARDLLTVPHDELRAAVEAARCEAVDIGPARPASKPSKTAPSARRAGWRGLLWRIGRRLGR